MKRIDELKADGDLIDQAGLGLCGEAAFFHHVIQHSPDLFAAMARNLFRRGWGFINDLTIHPDSDLRNADYAALSGTPPQADWMILSSFRDTKNLFFDFQGGPDEFIADGSFYFELDDWYLETKLYKSVKKYDDDDVATIRNTVVKTEKSHILLSIDMEMIDVSKSGGHVIALESPLTIDENADRVSFRYWSWGQTKDPNTKQYEAIRGDLTVAQFLDNYEGAIVATF